MTQSRDGAPEHSAVYRWLKDMLIDFRFRPGEPIMINETADRLRVSATPVRESLIRLRSEGFLDATPRRGFVTKVLHPKEMTELHELMWVILAHSTDVVRAFDIDMLGSIVVDHVHADSCTASPQWVIGQLDAIYERLAAVARNDVMFDIFRNASERTRYVRIIDLEDAEQLTAAARLIEDLPPALRAWDAGTASAMIWRDIDGRIGRMQTLVKDGISRSCAAILPDCNWVSQCSHPG